MIRSYKGITPTIPASCYVDDSAQIIGDVVLGEHASVWMNAVVRGDVHSIRIGAGSIIAAGTLIPEKTVVEPGSLWMGSPGKFRRKLEPKDQDSIMRYANNYLGYKEAYLAEKK